MSTLFFKRRRALPLLTAGLLAVCAPAQTQSAEMRPDTGAATAEKARKLPNVDLSEQVLYEFLLAEMAGQRGNVGLAAEAYADLAKSTRDPRLAERATEVALFARRMELALTNARLWLELEPDSIKAQQTVVALTLNSGKLEDARPALEKLIAGDGENRAKGFLQLNNLLTKQTDRKAVLALVEELAAPYPNMPEAQFAVAQAAWRAGEHDKALAASGKALKLKPDWEAAALFQGEALRQAKPEEASRFYNDYLNSHSSARDVRLAYARLLVGEKRYADARTQFGKLSDAFPDSPEVSLAIGLLSLELGDYSKADEQLQRSLKQGYPDTDSVYLYLGQTAESAGKTEDAAAWYRRVQTGDNQFAAQVRLANLLAKQGKAEEGAALIRSVPAKNDEQRAQIALAESRLWRDIKQYQRAYEALDRVLAKQPDNVELLYDHALAAEKVERYDVLEKDLRRAIKVKPDFAEAYNALGYTFADRNVRLEEAQALLDKALALEPDNAFILDSAGWLNYRRHDFGKAEDLLRRALSLRNDPEIAAHLGEVLWAGGKRDDADKVWRKALKESPDNEVLRAAMDRFKPGK